MRAATVTPWRLRQQLTLGATITLASLFCAGPGYAQLLDYAPFAGYALKKGILGNDITHPLPACITGNETSLGASRTSISYNIVTNIDEYDQAFHIDEKSSVSVLDVISGGDKWRVGRETTKSSTAFNIVIEASSESNSRTIDNIQWTQPWAAKMASRDPVLLQESRQACGDRFVQTVFNDVRLFAVLHVHSDKQSALTQLSYGVNGKIGIDYLEASAALGGDVSVRSAHQEGAISIEIQSEGLEFIPTLDAVKIANVSGDGLQDIANKLADYLREQKPVGQPVKYQLARYPGMPPENLDDQRITTALKALKRDYAFNVPRIENIDQLLAGDLRRSILRQPAADSSLRTQREALDRYLTTVARAHDICVKAANESRCAAASGMVGQPPPTIAAELPPDLSPLIGLVVFVVDGKPLLLDEGFDLVRDPNLTLLEAARRSRPAAQTVYVGFPIVSAFVTDAEFALFDNIDPPFPISVVGAKRAPAQSLQAPASFGGTPFAKPFVLLARADASNPCKIHHGDASGLNTLDASCLMPAGRAIVDLARFDVARKGSQVLVTAGLPMIDPLITTITTCFGHTSRTTVGGATIINTVSGPIRSMNTVVKIATAPMYQFALADVTEAHDMPGWRTIADQLHAEIAANAMLPNSAWAPTGSPCEPRIP